MIVPVVLPKLPSEPVDLCRERDRLTKAAGHGPELWTVKRRWPELAKARHQIIRDLAAWWLTRHPVVPAGPRPTTRAGRTVLAASCGRVVGRGVGPNLAACLGMHHTTVYLALGRFPAKPAPVFKAASAKSIRRRHVEVPAR